MDLGLIVEVVSSSCDGRLYAVFRGFA